MQTTLIILCILFGFMLIMMDLLFIPGGVVAALGGAFIVGALIAAYKLLGREAVMLLSLGSILLGGLLAYVSVKFKIWRRFVATGAENKDEGFASSKVALDRLVGKEGAAATVLRPGGIVAVEGVKYDAVAQDGFIEEGAPVEIVGVTTGQVLVKTKT